MTYDPSMTITSTIPAPEGSDSTSREGKAIPLPVMAGGNASPAPDVPPPDMVFPFQPDQPGNLYRQGTAPYSIRCCNLIKIIYFFLYPY